MEIVANVTESGGRIEFRCEKTGLVVRGDYVEWVLSAAAEMLSDMAERDMASKVEELETLVEFGEAQPVEIDTAKWAHKARFEIVPQCTITMNSTEYRWVAPVASDVREQEFGGNAVKRIHNMALTRNDTFLTNEDGVAPGNGDTH